MDTNMIIAGVIVLCGIAVLVVSAIIVRFLWSSITKAWDVAKGYLRDVREALKGKATENQLNSKGEFILDDHGVPKKKERKLFFKPVEAHAYLVTTGDSFQRAILELKDALFAKEVLKWSKNEKDQEKKTVFREISKLNKILFSDCKTDKDIENLIDNLPDWRVLNVPARIRDARFVNKFDKFIHGFGGYRFIDWLPWRGSLAIKRFTWNEVGDKDNDSTTLRNEETNFFQVNEVPYVFIIVGAEDNNNVPITVILQLQIKGVNPYQAFFRQKDFLRTIEGYTASSVAEILLNSSFASVIEAENNSADYTRRTEIIEKICQKVKSLNDEIFGTDKKGCEEVVGVVIRQVSVKQLEPTDSGLRDKIQSAMIRVFDAQQENQAIRELADAKAYDIEAVARATEKLIAIRNAANAATAEIMNTEALPRDLAAYSTGGGGGTLLNINPNQKK